MSVTPNLIAMRRSFIKKPNIITIAFFAILFYCIESKAQTGQSFTIENYYKVKWGYSEEFVALYKKNHYPLLKKAKEKGDIVEIIAERPLHHDTEEGRWDLKITLVFKNVAAAFDENLTTPYKKSLYPDQANFEKEEQRRFEILLAHWDVPVKKINLEE